MHVTRVITLPLGYKNQSLKNNLIQCSATQLYCNISSILDIKPWVIPLISWIMCKCKRCLLSCCYIIYKCFISPYVLVIRALCYVYWEAVKVLWYLTSAELGAMLLWRRLWSKYILALQLYIFLFRFSYWWMNDRLASLFIILRQEKNITGMPCLKIK